MVPSAQLRLMMSPAATVLVRRAVPEASLSVKTWFAAQRTGAVLTTVPIKALFPTVQVVPAQPRSVLA